MKKYFLVLFGVILAAGIVICTGAQHAVAADKNKYGGKIKFNFAKAADRFGVPWNYRHWNHVYNSFSCETLIDVTEKPGIFEPRLAHSWELGPDKKSYIFYLNKGVKFHDGTDFNAQSVKWNLDQWIPLKRSELDKMNSLEIIDDYTIKCNFSKWDSLIIADFSRKVPMYSPASFEKNGEEWADYHPVGTGPFKFEAFKRNTYVKYKRNDNYWIKGLPYVDGLEIKNVPDPMTAIAMLKNEDVIALMEVDSVTADELKQSGKYRVDYTPNMAQVIVMNSTNPDSVWSDIRMRAALMHAIDKKKIVDSLGRGFSFPIDEIISFCPGEPQKEIREYNPEKAKQLMKEAGHPDGVKVKLAVMAESPQDAYVALQRQLSEVGIDLDINKIKGATWNQLSFEPAPGSDLRVELMRISPNDPLSSVKESLSSTSLYLPALKRPEGLDDLLQQALSAVDNNRVNSILAQMEEMAYKDIMLVPLWDWPVITVSLPVLEDADWQFKRSGAVRLERAYFNDEKYKR